MTKPNWEGADGASEHRTVGPHRAWCHGDHEWCYPEDRCPCCQEAAERLREQIINIDPALMDWVGYGEFADRIMALAPLGEPTSTWPTGGVTGDPVLDEIQTRVRSAHAEMMEQRVWDEMGGEDKEKERMNDPSEAIWMEEAIDRMVQDLREAVAPERAVILISDGGEWHPEVIARMYPGADLVMDLFEADSVEDASAAWNEIFGAILDSLAGGSI